MPTNRKLVFLNDHIYHVYNRGVEKRSVYTSIREYRVFLQTSAYYQYQKVPTRFSRFETLPEIEQMAFFRNQNLAPKRIELLAYCLMPNHFHFLIRQCVDTGITTFMNDLANSYTRYFNTKHTRVGPLFQGTFKAVHIETDDQLVHVTRYIHINPYVSSLVSLGGLATYPWSSFMYYVTDAVSNMINPQPALSLFPSREAYRQFVFDQTDYAKKLEEIKHLTYEE